MTDLKTSPVVSGSFRDPSGFLFWRGGSLYRQVNASYKDNYDHLMDSGLYKHLTGEGLLVPHEEVDVAPPRHELAYKVIRPQLIPFISYPYECHFCLKSAAGRGNRLRMTKAGSCQSN